MVVVVDVVDDGVATVVGGVAIVHVLPCMLVLSLLLFGSVAYNICMILYERWMRMYLG